MNWPRSTLFHTFGNNNLSSVAYSFTEGPSAPTMKGSARPDTANIKAHAGIATTIGMVAGVIVKA